MEYPLAVSSTDNTHSLFKPDPEKIRAHLEQLFRRARVEYPDGLCEIAWADGRGQVTSANTFPITPEGLDEATKVAIRHNNECRNLYVGVNPRKPGTPPWGRASAIDVEIAFCHFVDADTAKAADRLRKAPLPYTWAVTTGRVPNPRPHAYWDLEEPTRNMDAWSRQQRALADYFGGDAVIDSPRIMRLAGTVNYPTQKKIEKGYRTELVTLRTLYDDEERDPISGEALFRVYSWSTPHESYDPETGEVLERGAPTGQSGGAEPNFGTSGIDPLQCIRNINAGINLHNNARDLVNHLIATGHRDWLIREFLSRLLTPVSDGGTLSQIDTFIRTWRQKTDTPDPEEDFNAPPPGAEPPPDPEECSIAAWLARDIPQPDFLLGELFSTTSRGMMVAPTGLGKTNFGLAIAFSMAAGKSFLHWGGQRASRILFVEGEMSKRLVKARIGDAVRRAGVAPEKLYVLSRDAIENLPPLNTATGQRFVDEFIENIGGVDFVIFDNVQALLEGDMKDEVPWQATLPWIRDLTHRNIGQLWLHHTGHNEAQSYGTKTREWQLDTVMLMEKIERPETDIAFNITFTKARERAPDNRTNFDPVIITLASDQWVSEGGVARRMAPSPLGLKFYYALLDALTIPDAIERFAGRPAVTSERWRLECVRIGLIGVDAGNSDRALFSKYRRELISCNYIACNNDLVWAVK
jgi:hypothetical protein